MGRQLALLLVVFAAGSAIGYVARSMAGDPVETAGPAARAPAAPAPSDERPLPELPRETARSLSAAVAALPSPDVERSPEAIRGTLRTGEGDPVGGVKIIARTYSEAEKPDEDASFEEEVREYVKRRAFERAACAEAITGSDGTFVLTGLVDARYRISGESDDWTVSVRQGQRRETRPGVEVELIATAVVTLDVSVRLPDDTEPKTATICWSGGSVARERPMRYPWRPGERKVRLVPGTYSLWATGGELLELASAKQELTLTAGERHPPLVLRLGDQPGILGTVAIAEGEPVMQLMAAALKLGAQEAAEPKRLLQEATSRTSVRMDRGGAFAITEVEAGRYLVGVFESNRVFAHAVVDVADRLVPVALVVPAADRSEYAVVWVEGPDGKAAGEQTWVTVNWRSLSRGGWGGGQGATRQADGSYRAYFPEAPKPEEASDAVWVLSVNSQKYGSRTVEFARAEATIVRVRMEEPAFVDAILEGYAGSGCEGCVDLNVTLKEGGSGGSGKPDGDGRCRMGPVAPGAAAVQVMVSEPRKGRNMIVLRQEVDLVPGTNSVALRMPPLYDLTVVLTDDTAGTNVMLMGLDAERGGPSSYARSDGSGKVLFEHLPAGRYRVHVSGRESGTMEVTVPAQSVVRFEAMVFDCFVVRITDASGLFGRAGFAEGDLVTAIDGTELTSQRQMGALFSAAMVREKSEFTVLRAGRTLTIPFPGPEYEKSRGNAGGSFEPARR